MAEPGPGKDAELLRATGPQASGPGLLHACLYALSVAVFIVAVATDLSVVIELWLNSFESWAYFRITLIMVPSCLIQFLSFKWYQTNDVATKHQCVLHLFQLAIVHRFYLLFDFAVKNANKQVGAQEKDWISRIANDTLTINMFTAMLLFVPQIVFLAYIHAVQQYFSFISCASMLASIFSLTWSMIFYAAFMSRSTMNQFSSSWSSIMIQGFWRGGMLASRISALVLGSICFNTWILVFFGVHALSMTSWIIHQTTNFCIPAVEELVYKCLIGSVYFFDYFKLTDSEAKHQVCIFYSVMVAQNVLIYYVYLTSFMSLFQTNILVTSSILILGGSTIGTVSMSTYFCIFHDSKTKEPDKHTTKDTDNHIESSTPKRISKLLAQNAVVDVESVGNPTSDVTADKKSLLTNIEQNIEIAEKGIINTSFTNNDEASASVQVVLEDEKMTSLHMEKFQSLCTSEKTLEDARVVNVSTEHFDESRNCTADPFQRQKRRGICSEIELGLKPIEGNLDLDPQLCSQKRRGICSLAQLGLELITDEQNYVEKSFSTLGTLKSDSESSSHHIAEKSLNSSILDAVSIRDLVFNSRRDQPIPESVLVRGRLSTPSTGSDSGDSLVAGQLQQPSPLPPQSSGAELEEDTTASYAASIHDYENVCPLGVARPPWCIRSWRGYTDIETYIHDDSVVRDRRRDTLTSTATGTTLSSADLSDTTTYASSPLRRLAPQPGPRRTRQDDYLDTLVYDLVERAESPSTTGLDPIAEEREEQPLSSLVATIDEIRRCAPDGSPAPLALNSMLTSDSQQSQPTTAATTTLRQLRQRRRLLLEPGTPLINAILSDSPILAPKADVVVVVAAPDEDNVYVAMNALGAQRCSTEDHTPCLGTVPIDKEDILSREDVDLTESADMPSRKRVVFSMTNEIIKDLSDSCSEQSDTTAISIDTTNAASFHSESQRTAVNRPRRKFSLLRERFEPKSADHPGQLPASEIFTNSSAMSSMMTQPYSFVMLNNDSNSLNLSACHDQENLMMKPSMMIEEKILHSDSLKDKRNLFFKQFLSPPKFPGWGKKRTFSPNAKITPKTY
ncbi:hypothetical protein QAD02_021988 [Eretmocerus hayati]|uniref:Uncharacterized protein n=1 Tax=Eretmocerus hayati TaxID=131215 RepID=A0ACC2PU95_9HYME|nr:hypothetical protein QAD02_021988 [Eretmocerus hayati]